MSDFRRNNPNPNDLPEGVSAGENGRNLWQMPDPFAPYDDPAASPGSAPPQEDYSAWRRPPSVKGPSFLTDDPAPYGAEMLQGGVPLFTQPEAINPDPNFSRQGEDAPTRIGTPSLASQMVNKRKTVARGEPSSFAPPSFPMGGGVPAEGPIPPEDARPPFVPEAMPSSAGAFSPPESGGNPSPRRNRRAGRVARYQELENNPAPIAPPPAQEAPPPRVPYFPPEERPSGPPAPDAQAPFAPVQGAVSQGFDPFEAGDSETPGQESPRPARRPAMPGERYTGARTAMPISGAPMPRSQVGALPEEEDASLAESPRQNRDRVMARPPRDPQEKDAPSPRYEEGALRERSPQGMPGQGQRPTRPQGAPAQRPGQGTQSGPRPQRPGGAPGQRPPQGMPGQAPRPQRPPERHAEEPDDSSPARRPARDREGMPPARKTGLPGNRPTPQYEQDSDRYAPSRRNRDDSDRHAPTPSVRRPRYDFEDEEDISPRRRGCLVPLVILLLVVGVALAGICLPDWQAMGGGIGTALGGAKATLTDLFGNVKELVFPTEVRVTSFTVAPTEGTAPTELVLIVQTSTSVTQLRFVDEQGNVLLEKELSDQDTLEGKTVTKNSKGLIWQLKYIMEQSYIGLLTVQTQLPDGTWDEGMPSATPIQIAPPAIALPPVTSFSSDTTEGPVPATIRFTMQTSDDVEAVRIVDDYGTPVATYHRADGTTQAGNVTESLEGLDWELTATVEVAYEGNYKLEYLTASDLDFAASEFYEYVDLSEPISPDDSSSADDGSLNAGGDDPQDAQADNPNEPEGDIVVAANAQADQLDGLPNSGDAGDPEETPGAPAQTPAPEPIPLPALSAEADESASPSAISLKRTLYNELKTTESYSRTKTVSMVDPFNYAVWKQSGVLTFRSGPFRQNAAYGTLEKDPTTLTELWKVPVGSKKLSKSTVHGIAWPGQPAIVKWSTEIRNLMNLNDEKKATTALKEVILGGQDGKIYFLDLNDGLPTREAIDMGAPSGGGVSIAANGTPILGIGQSHSNLSGKQVPNGYHLYNLLNGKELLLLDGRDKSANSNFSGASGAALFDKQTQTLVVGGQNGVLYTVELNETFDYVAGSLKISPAIQRYKTLAAKQDKKATNIDASVAMYNNYIYYADDIGVLQCVDINTLSTVWAVKTGDNVDSTPALDFEEDSETVALYTGNTISRQGKSGVCTIRRLSALTGKEDWAYTVPDLHYTTEYKIGCMASPVVGENAIDDLVIFTVTDGSHGSHVIALKKADGSVAWTKKLDTEGESSPVAVYNTRGDAWLIQGERDGSLHLMDARTGETVSTLKLEGAIEASPAVYRNTLVIGTTGKDTGFIYGIRIE